VKYRYLTNNPIMVDDIYGKVEYSDTGILELFHKVEQEIFKGFKLLSHPLTSSIRPDISPYKTVILSAATGAIDEESLSIIQKSIDYTYRLISSHEPPDWGEDEKLDFQFVDRSIINYAVERNQ
jgi:hypothetical protein